MRQEDAAVLADFSRRYRDARLQEGWRPLTREQALALPYGSPPGYPALYWAVRRQSYEALTGVLSRQGPAPEAGAVADVGAGTGWLAHRLAEARYRVVAVETSLERDFGLGAAPVYLTSSHARFLPVQGDLERPPLQRDRLSLAIFNASLHYARDLAATLRRTAEALQRGGRLIVLDTPVTRHPVPGGGREGRLRSPERPRRALGRQELEEALVSAGLRPRWVPVRRGPRWWVYRAKTWLRGDVRFSFPMVIADRPR